MMHVLVIRSPVLGMMMMSFDSLKVVAAFYQLFRYLLFLWFLCVSWLPVFHSFLPPSPLLLLFLAAKNIVSVRTKYIGVSKVSYSMLMLVYKVLKDKW